MSRSLLDADDATVRTVDAVVALWVVLWLVLACWTAYSVWVLGELGQTMTSAGRALDSTGRGLQSVGEVPVIGESTRALGDQVRTTAVQIVGNGLAIEGQVRRLALLLGVSLFFIPVTPVVGFWGPARLARRRECADVRRAIAAHSDDAGLTRFLAGRAVDRLPYTTLKAVSGDPYGDLAAGRWDRLAGLELARMGIDEPLATGPGPGSPPGAPEP